MTDPRQALAKWIADPAEATLSPLGAGSSFSGAGLWKVEHHGRQFVLRRWPSNAGSACEIGAKCALQLHLANANLPVPQPLFAGEALLVAIGGSLPPDRRSTRTWSLTTWLPGVANYWSDPRIEKLEAAMVMLARVHESAAEFLGKDRVGGRRVDISPAVQKRLGRFEELTADGLASLRDGARHVDSVSERALAEEAIELIACCLPSTLRASRAWKDVRLPLQWRLGDVWHDHVLFIDDRVTGVIDFGAAGVDSPAQDVARLLGSLIGDDADLWWRGLTAYESARPLSDVERDVARYFDKSGRVASAANWVAWLWPRFPAAAPEVTNRAAAVERLRRLVARLRVLAARGD